jgi:histidine ammonia-lyase
MSSYHSVTDKPLTLGVINDILSSEKKLKLSNNSKKLIVDCRDYLDLKLKQQTKPVYGINTGFGSLHNVKISSDNLTKLQENLVMSHACGMGATVPLKIVKLMLLLKIQSLSYGHSGVQLDTVERLVFFFNNDIIPVVYTQGSLGASGDLAPLAHLALPLLSKGEVWLNGEVRSSESILKQFQLNPISLKSKEGLALLNGTQFMIAYGVYCLIESFKLSYWADLIGSMSLDAFYGHIEPFNNLVHHIRPHEGQIKTARRVMDFLKDSELMKQEKHHVQDPYSFRCIPQVHGATKDTLQYVSRVFTTEMNSVTDNPLIFVDEDEIISGGNFHGQPLALALDFLKIAMAELGNISERRTFQLVSGNRGLPAFLIDNPGLNSGFMIPQYTAASIVSANKQLATPASVDSIVSSNGQEDHVSMGANAAVQAYDIINNVKTILAIELLNAAQAIQFRKPLKSSPAVEEVLTKLKFHVKFVEEDEILHNLINGTLHFIDEFDIEHKFLFD